jgi:hypothetical protein
VLYSLKEINLSAKPVFLFVFRNLRKEETLKTGQFEISFKDVAEAARADQGTASQPEYNLVPNPAKNYVDVQTNLSKTGTVTVKIMDTSGKILINNSETVESGRQSIKINTEKLLQGTYIVEIKS